MNSPMMQAKPFNLPEDFARILEYVKTASLGNVTYGSSGTIDYAMVKFPLYKDGGNYIGLKFFFGSDSDADNAEAVDFSTIFGEDFTAAIGVFLTPVNNAGSAASYSGLSATGFTYVLGGSNLAISWMAVGFDIVAA